MRRALLRNASFYTRQSSSSAVPLAVSTRPRLRFFSSDEKPKDSDNKGIFSAFDTDGSYNAGDIIMEKISRGEYYFNLDDAKMFKEVHEEMYWNKSLPDYTKQKVDEKFNELRDMCERGELTHKEVVQFDDTSVPDKKKDNDDPPGEGPILRWPTGDVFAPWHPKYRKVKLSVTVKELGLSDYQFRRLRELVGERYDPEKDELTITSERFEHRAENRKDCLRTLLSLIEEAGKAN